MEAGNTDRGEDPSQTARNSVEGKTRPDKGTEDTKNLDKGGSYSLAPDEGVGGEIRNR